MSVLHHLLFIFTFYLSISFLHFSHLPIPTSGNHQSLLCTYELIFLFVWFFFFLISHVMGII